MADTGTFTPGRAAARLGTLLTLGGIASCITLVYLAMRSVMEIGGSCAEGGPYVVARPCPEGIPLAMVGGIFGGAIMVLLNIVLAKRGGTPSLVLLAWPALFLSLGYNFLDFGLNPPDDSGLVWGWLICAVVFGLMGGLPLLLLIRTMLTGNIGGQGEPRGIAPIPGLGGRGLKTNPADEPPKFEFEKDFVSVPVTFSDTEGQDVVSALERLVALRDSGELTVDEFAEAKRRLLRDKP
jgi:hypothetical protein